MNLVYVLMEFIVKLREIPYTPPKYSSREAVWCMERVWDWFLPSNPFQTVHLTLRSLIFPHEPHL